MFSVSRAAQLPLFAITGLPLLLVAAQAQAQATAAAPAPSSNARPDPADARAPVPAVLYASPLRAYQGFTDAPITPWRDANVLVQQRGGWRAYAREVRQPDAAQAAVSGASQPASATKPAAGGHAGHQTQ